MLVETMTSFPAVLALSIFFIAYFLVITEEFTLLKKSKPVILASGLIWLCVAVLAQQQDKLAELEVLVKANLQEYGELMLFLIVAMTYVNVMCERKVFIVLRNWLVNHNFSMRTLFWMTGFIAFFLSPLVDNLTTVLIMGAVVTSAGKHHPKFVALSCINIVVAANAGGVFSPFGDITSLMVWQAGYLQFADFYRLFLPALFSFIVPAIVMSCLITNSTESINPTDDQLSPGAIAVIFLFGLTITLAIIFKSFFHLPPVLGMMTGFGILKFYGYYFKKRSKNMSNMNNSLNSVMPLTINENIESNEWDTLLFFYGVMMCIGGLAAFGYLEFLSRYIYSDLGLGLSVAHIATPANIAVGFVSSIFGNIPILFSVIKMSPEMSQGQWLLITLTTGLGGSILSIGSAAGVALMGQAKGSYTFMSHLKFAPIIVIGYFVGVAAHIWINASVF